VIPGLADDIPCEQAIGILGYDLHERTLAGAARTKKERRCST
jgi:hypothetical protein